MVLKRLKDPVVYIKLYNTKRIHSFQMAYKLLMSAGATLRLTVCVCVHFNVVSLEFSVDVDV